MKKYILLTLTLLCGLGLGAKDLSGVKIYVNPGHGGFDAANDRNIITIPFGANDTCGLWESSSNLTKGLALRDMLEASNATVLMSRVLNRDEDDRVLTEIGEEANANNCDVFLSIHSNAVGTNTGTNYLLLLFRGTDAEPDPAAGKDLAATCWPRMFDNPLTVWTHYSATNQNIRGDFSYYGYHLGVLRLTTVPGFLSEGEFHDYMPEAHRLLNEDYRKLEAARFHRYFCDYFKADLPNKGIIAGWVKGYNERINEPKYVYKSGSDDQWLPLNGATVTLQRPDGTEVGVYQVDSFYNGVFTFFDLEPGDYKLVAEADEHLKGEYDVTVEPGLTASVKIFLNNVVNPPVRPVPPDYADPDQEAGIMNMPHYEFAEGWKYTAGEGVPEWLDRSIIKKMLYANDQLYVLTTTPGIYRIDPSTGEKTGELKLDGISGGVKTISDIAVSADGYLMACNKDTVSLPESNGRAFKVYYWENDTVQPKIFFSTTSQGNFSNAVIGETFAVSGPLWKCRVYTTAITTGSSKQIRVIGYEKEEDVEMLGYKYMLDTENYTEGKWGERITFVASPLNDGGIVVDGEKILPTEYVFDWTAPDREPLTLKGMLKEGELQKAASGVSFFKYAGHAYMAALQTNENGGAAQVVLFDVNDGLDNARRVSDLLPEGGLDAENAALMSTAAHVSGYDIQLYGMAQGQGIARYQTVAGTPIANIYASELRQEPIEKGYKLSFTLNEKADQVTIEVLSGDQVIGTFDAGAMEKGRNSFDVTNEMLPNGTFTWQVTASAPGVMRPVKYTDNAQPEMQFYSSWGVTVDNHFESPYFGRVYVSEGKGGQVTDRQTTNGVYIMDAALSDVTGQGQTAYGGGQTWSASNSPFRVFAAPDGNVFMADFSDTHPGVWMMNPADPSADFQPVFDPSLARNSDGLVSNEGVNVHGSIAACYVTGTGDDRTLYTFDEDYKVGNYAGNLLQYNIGTLATPWRDAPSAVVYDNGANGHKHLNMTVNIAPDGRGGWWISQYRAADEEGVPSLVHIGTDGMINFNSGKTPLLLENSVRGGMAVNADGSRIAMGCNNEIKIMEVNFDENGVPTLTKLHSIEPALGANTNSLAFDQAGNVYAVSNSGERLGAWALPKAENTFTTPAPSAQQFEITGSFVAVEETPVQKVSVYPNPTRGMITIEGTGIRSVALFDMSGRMVWSRTGQESNREQIDLSSYAEGMYILKVNDEVMKITKE